MLSLGLLDELAFECGHLIPPFPTQAMENVLSSSWAEAKAPEIHQETPDKGLLWRPSVMVWGGHPREPGERRATLISTPFSPPGSLQLPSWA